MLRLAPVWRKISAAGIKNPANADSSRDFSVPRRRLEDYEQRRKQIELSDVAGDGGTLDTETGIVSYSTRPETVSYAYRTNAPTNATANAAMLPVSWEAVYDEPVLSGDLDGDGELTSADVVLLARYLAGAETLTEAQLTAADLNADGVITSADLVLLARKVAGL